MKILLLTKKVPFPLTDGEVIAIHNLSKGLVEQGCELHLLALNTQKHYVSFDETPAELSHFTSIEMIAIDTRVRFLPALKCLLKGESYNINRFISEDFKQALKHKLSLIEVDVVQLETLYMAPYIDTIRDNSTAKVCLRSHNVESEIWKNLSTDVSGLKGWYLKHCAKMLSRFEGLTQSTYDFLLPITKLDAEHFASRGEQALTKVVTVGLSMDKYHYKQPTKTIRKIGFLGSLDWQPNLEGLDWFLDEVWSVLSQQSNNLEFHIGGRNMPIRYSSLKRDGVVIHKQVESAIDYVNDMDVILVPLFSGSGIRVKILEAMALGKVVLSTPKGFEGIGVTNNENAIVFNNASQLIEQLELINKINVSDLGAAARTHIEKNFSAQAVSKDLIAFYKNALNIF